MKYGLKDSLENDEKSSIENPASENKVVVPLGETVETAVKSNEDDSESSAAIHKIVPETETSSQPPLPPINEQPLYNETINQIVLELTSDKPREINPPTNEPIQTLTIQTQLIHIECETEAMTCDAARQETVMEVVTSNDEEPAEVEMFSKPATPNDMDTTENCAGEIIDEQMPKHSANYNFANQPIVELSRYSWGADQQKYLRGCLFSPDGTCVLTTVNKDGMHIVELPLSLYDNESVSVDRPLDILTSAVHVPEGGTVYDYCWYPFMHSTSPETCCFISTRQHEPLQLWDAFDGKLRCTYRGYDAVDEVESALSVCFSIDGSQVIAGYKKTLKIFRTDVPGRDYTNFAIKSPAACLAINSSDANMIAIGSWNSFVTFHDVRSPKLTVTEKLVKHTGGVTHMQFTDDGNRLITGARKDSKLIGWDVRNVTVPLFTLHRNVETNQKIYFDLSRSDRWLVSGDTTGILHAYDLKYGTENGKFPDYQYPLHRDCCNGVSLHPSRPIVCTASGQHHFIGIEKDIALKSADVQENCLIFWWCGNSD